MEKKIEEERRRLQRLAAEIAATIRKEAAVQTKLRSMGKCVAGFEWYQQGSGWRCRGFQILI